MSIKNIIKTILVGANLLLMLPVSAFIEDYKECKRDSIKMDNENYEELKISVKNLKPVKLSKRKNFNVDGRGVYRVLDPSQRRPLGVTAGNMQPFVLLDEKKPKQALNARKVEVEINKKIKKIIIKEKKEPNIRIQKNFPVGSFDCLPFYSSLKNKHTGSEKDIIELREMIWPKKYRDQQPEGFGLYRVCFGTGEHTKHYMVLDKKDTEKDFESRMLQYYLRIFRPCSYIGSTEKNLLDYFRNGLKIIGQKNGVFMFSNQDREHIAKHGGKEGDWCSGVAIIEQDQERKKLRLKAAGVQCHIPVTNENTDYIKNALNILCDDHVYDILEKQDSKLVSKLVYVHTHSALEETLRTMSKDQDDMAKKNRVRDIKIKKPHLIRTPYLQRRKRTQWHSTSTKKQKQ